MPGRSIACAALAAAVLTVAAPAPARAQLGEVGAFLATLDNHYRVVPDVTYHVASGHENKLDVYAPRNRRRPRAGAAADPRRRVGHRSQGHLHDAGAAVP